MSRITIDPERCVRDGLCVRVCEKVFSRETIDSVPLVAHEDSCNGCGHCALICPTGAIWQEESPPELIHPVEPRLMPTYEQVREMIVTRRSVRNFQDRRVEREVLEKVIDGACYAPSAKNSRSTEYIVVTDKALLAEIAAITAQWLGDVSRKLRNPLWRRLYMLYGEKDVEEIKRWVNQFDLIAERARNHWDVILFKAPAVLFFHARRSIRFGETNAALAVQNAVYTASSLGLGSFFTGYVVAACSREKRLPLLLGLPKGHILYGGLALGYPELGFPTWIERTAQHITWRDGT